MNSVSKASKMSEQKNSSYWKESLSLVTKILLVWFSVSFGAGIIFKDSLDQFQLGHAPLGFWMAQQGSILCFVFLLIIYARKMNKLDEKYGFSEKED